ncbi:hypothetical protein MY11210_003796 [Beauveria gryllotalpidicola]
MLMNSLASIQAAAVYTANTVPIEKTYGMPASAKNGAGKAAPGGTKATKATNNDDDVGGGGDSGDSGASPEKEAPPTNQQSTGESKETGQQEQIKRESTE